MRGNVIGGALLCALFIAGGSSGAAYAVDDPYTPVTPTESGLAGSRVTPLCVTGEPWISYRVVTSGIDDPPPAEAELVLSDGGSTLELALGETLDGSLSGRIPWPDAAWTRDGVDAVLRVGTVQIAVPLGYPAATEECAPSPVQSWLSATGSAAPIALLLGGGTATIAAGLAAYLVARRRRRSVTVRR
jgi:hypothetical protein